MFLTWSFSVLLAVMETGSKASPCKQLSGRPCTCSRKYPGYAVLVGNACKKCGEYRCKTHCACGRSKTALGRNAPRTLTAEVRRLLSTRTQQQAQPEPTESLVPRGAPSPQTWSFSDSANWWQELFTHTSYATEVELSSLMC